MDSTPLRPSLEIPFSAVGSASGPCSPRRSTCLAGSRKGGVAWIGLAPLLFVLVSAPPVLAIDALSHDTAPTLSDRELGNLRHFVRLARQDLDDWSGWEAADQKGMEAYRYQIAFMTYALVSQQYHSVPAYRDLYQDTIDRLITRMLSKPVWEFWEEVSKTSPEFDPDWEGPQPGTRDPVGEKNIMYSGHLLHMIALYEMLYRDDRWSQPGALLFRWDDDVAFRYDYAELVARVHDEMMTPRREGSRDVGAMECEPNLVFPECNQHPTLAFMLFDRRHGTSYGESARAGLESFFANTGMHDPATGHTAAWYMIKQDRTMVVPLTTSASADGWTGAFMHAWDPDAIAALYEKQRNDYIHRDPSTGEVELRPDPSADLGLAFFANFAVEMGDEETAALLFDYADAHYRSSLDSTGFHYLPGRDDPRHPVTNTTDRLMALAHSNRPKGLWRLHNEPWQEADFGTPVLQKVAFPAVLVRQAFWDAAGGTLFVTLEPAAETASATTFQLANLDPAHAYTLYREGETVARIAAGGEVEGMGARRVMPGTIEIEADIAGAVRFRLAADSGR